MSCIPRLIRGLLGFSDGHHRLTLFWALSVIGLILPWLTSCESPTLSNLFRQEQTCSVQSIHDGHTPAVAFVFSYTLLATRYLLNRSNVAHCERPHLA